MPAGVGMPGMAGMAGMPGMAAAGAMPMLPGGLPSAGTAGVDPAVAGMLGGLATSGMASMPPGTGMDAEQMAMMQRMLASMGQPLSPPETLAAIDQLGEIGLMPPQMLTEMKECMVLLPQSAPALGMAMGMFKPVLPQLREARQQMHALPPGDQDELAATLAHELQSVSADDRKAFVDSLSGGFFPSSVVDGLKVQLGTAGAAKK
jgi:hypothetical protein